VERQFDGKASRIHRSLYSHPKAKRGKHIRRTGRRETSRYPAFFLKEDGRQMLFPRLPMTEDSIRGNTLW
jgi:hypothetical protein